jgi:hypothetical protein
MHLRIFPTMTIFATLIAGPLVAAPQEEEAKDVEDSSRFSLSDFSFRVGFYRITATTEIRLDGRGGRIGTSIDLEDDLDLQEEKSASYLSFAWRMSGRHFLEMEQFTFKRSGSTTLSGEFEFGDTVFEFGALVDSYFDTRVTRISYAYVVHDSDKFVLGLSAGLHITKLNTGIRDVVRPFSDEDVAFAAVTAPLPVIGMTAGWRINEQWFMYGRVQIFRLSIDDYAGQLDHASVKLEYDAFKHVGIGVGYDLFDLGLDIDKRLWNGNINFRFHGPILYLKGYF